jgi:hypothetical protein
VYLSQTPSISLKLTHLADPNSTSIADPSREDATSVKETAKGTPGVDLSASEGYAESVPAAVRAAAFANAAFGVLASDKPAFAVDDAAFAADDAAFAADDAAVANPNPPDASAESAANFTSAGVL